MKLEEAKEKCKELVEHNYLEDLGYLRIEKHYINFNTAIETILQEIEHLQKENEELKRKNERLIDRTIQYDKTLENLHKNTIWKEKIRNLIEKSTLNSIHINELIKLLKEG